MEYLWHSRLQHLVITLLPPWPLAPPYSASPNCIWTSRREAAKWIDAGQLNTWVVILGRTAEEVQGPSLAIPPTTSLLWSPIAYESGAFLLPDTGWPWGVVLCLPNSLAWYERLMSFLQESVRASSSYTNTAPNSCIFVASPGRALATPTIFILTTKAPGLDSTKQGRCGPAWHGCTEGPANMSSYKLPGLGDTWAQQGWMFLKATKPLSATTPTVLPPLSRYLTPLVFFPPTNFSVEFCRILQLPGGCSFRGSIISLTVSCRSCLKGREVPHFENA